jgi:hypothetical protein
MLSSEIEKRMIKFRGTINISQDKTPSHDRQN